MGTRRRRPTMASTLGEVLRRILGGLLLFLAALGTIIVPLAVGSALYGSNWGASAGCVASALLQLGLIGLLNRFPDVPGEPIVSLICGKLLMLMIVFAPIGAAIELIDDRATATWTGMAVGAAILILGYLATRWRSARQGQLHTVGAAVGAAAGTTPTDHGGGVDGGRIDGGGVDGGA